MAQAFDRDNEPLGGLEFGDTAEEALKKALDKHPDAAKVEITLPQDGLDFSQALDAIKLGDKVKRTGWNGPDQFVFLVHGSTFIVNRPPLLGIYPEGTEINYHAHIDIRNQQGVIVPWLASQGDLLAEDWEVVD